MLHESIQTTIPGLPVASLTMDGLGLCCFNAAKDKERWEIAFLRVKDEHGYRAHSFNITVREKDLLGREISNNTYPVPADTRELEFKVTNGSNAHYGMFKGGCISYDPLPFSRKGLPSNDFRWTIDYVGREVPHGKFKNLKKKKDHKDRFDVTLVYIPHSLLYVDRVCRDTVRISPSGTDAFAKGSFELGRTNEELGGALFATAPEKFEIRDRGGIMDLIERPYVPGNSYEISLTNLDRYNKRSVKERQFVNGYALGDFHYYYNVIELDGNQYYLWAPARLSPRGREGDCHMVQTSLPTLTPLLE